MGGLVFVFIDPAQSGPGYIIATVGLLIVGITLLATLWWGTIGRERQRNIPGQPSSYIPLDEHVQMERQRIEEKIRSGRYFKLPIVGDLAEKLIDQIKF